MTEDIESTSRHRFLTFLSFGTYNITWTIPSATMSLFMYFYYHTVVGLNPLWILTVVAINTAWAGLNDPLIGWLTDRNFKWTRKWGRRFPWIAIGIIPLSLSLIMIFSAPDLPKDALNVLIDPLPVMLWLLLSLFIYDLFITLVEIHTSILRADKFRTETERRKYAGSWGFFDMIAQVLGMMLPPLLLIDGSYMIMAAIMALIMIIFGIIFVIKGAREDKIIIDRYYSRDYERINVFKGVLLVIKQKSFISLYASYTLWLTASTIAIGMVAYLVTFLLQSTDPDAMVIYFAFFLLGGLLSIPVWLKILKKTKNNKKLYLIGSFVLIGVYASLTFFQTEIDLIIIMFFVGFVNGCVWTIGMPVLYANVQDDFVIRQGKNQKGILVGTWAVIGLITAFIDEALITLVFTLTSFEPGIPDYATLIATHTVAEVELILLGIRLLLGIIPACSILVGTLIFWKLYPLTPEKVLDNKAKLIELGF
ncbi:MAG: MFS transporter [Candidatus Lokiarchaeota archaeon]|nr:MFS transporter [Candidatus Lokiarchaeota archaeon]